MEKIPNLFLMAILALITVNSNIPIIDADSCEYLSIFHVGCPGNPDGCTLACQPCNVGIGRITAVCAQGYPYPECRCYFEDGAPCPPPIGSLPCPYRPPSTALEGVDHPIGQNGTKPSA